MTHRPFIIDTDFSTDVGDFGYVALACAAHRVGWINLLGVMACVSASKAPGGIDAVRTYFQLPEIAVGTWKGTSHDATNTTWSAYIYDNHPHTVQLASTVPDATSEYRRLLAAADDGTVVIVAGGYMHNLSGLLNSTADGYSGLTGAQLITAKVARLYIMGSYAPANGSEWNMVGGGSPTAGAPAAANNVAANWPTPIVWSGYNLGTFSVGGQLGFSAGNIVYDAYTQAGYSSGRTAWDELTLLAAIQHDADFTMTRGTNVINATTGANTWTASSVGPHYALGKTQADAWYQARINVLLGANPASSPLISSWGSAPAYLEVCL